MKNIIKKYLPFYFLFITSSLLSQNFDEIHFENDSILNCFLLTNGEEPNKKKLKVLDTNYKILYISLNEIEIIKNLNKQIIYQKLTNCTQCNGNGKIKKHCKKYTIIRSYDQEKKQRVSKKKIHALCGGKGYHFEKCKKCNGEGKIK